MAKSLEELRADLAQACGLFLTGAATGGGVNQIIDTNGLARFTEDDALIGGLAYIRTDVGGGGAAPEGQSRFITDFAEAGCVITLEYNLTAAVGAGDTYEVYRVPLTLAQWDECVNVAIREAWPEVWAREVETVISTGATAYELPDTVEEVLEVQVAPVGVRYGWPAMRMARAGWVTEGTPGTDLGVLFVNTVPGENEEIRFVCRGRYAELERDEETDLDYPYIMAAARANLYAMLADEAGGQADAGRYLQLMNHWQQVAGQRKQALAEMLAGSVGRRTRERS